MIKVIQENNEIYAKIIKNNHFSEKSEFFSDINDDIQFGVLNYKKDYKTGAHFHNHPKEQSFQTDEIILIQKGSARIDFYCSKGTYIKSVIANQGDIVILYKGGHNITYQEDSQIFLVKKGPFIKDNNQTRIIATNNLELIIDKD